MSASEIVVIALVVLAVVAVVVVMVGRKGSSPEFGTTSTLPKAPESGLAAAIRRALSAGMRPGIWEEVEEALIASDVGVDSATAIVESARRYRPQDIGGVKEGLGTALLSEFLDTSRELILEGSPAVILVVGVNGNGKTTTVAKLANLLQERGQTVVLGAADTFRAAAGQQLKSWGDRLGARVVTGAEGADPASVVFDTVSAARAGSMDVALIDTAGRLHGKKNLMAELAKIHRIAGQVSEVLLVIDSNAGQNALAQVREFGETVPVSGVVLTKYDGTAKGGVVVSVERQLGVPVKFVGVGEKVEDLERFDPASFVDSLTEDV